ncbi:hypothetical protein [Roseivirga pacifica]|uniref:hypothetical protein n=1 Tax=Roseivirga pacifica TaxID=1267423 RepID=UPI0020941D08|nr:hypothetical protein [Roseivirga pacifica]MCO6358190.1 hypothetical protein [Roseivirga pacifica]MCO6366628.1 hypothetical protein [Roseivirga pacifica]MCO6371113.1 hypothetical protein [Roseivirga pacifica]MCO6373921.1 hypothetical protein [Roseivirga pacifica]MCO6380902.1 hypothetical protein [Roseivirga pacifica]
MGLFGKKKEALVEAAANEWRLSGLVTDVKRCEKGAFFTLKNEIPVQAGTKKMFHQVRVSEQLYHEVSDMLQPGIQLAVCGEVFYGAHKVFNKAFKVEVV